MKSKNNVQLMCEGLIPQTPTTLSAFNKYMAEDAKALMLFFFLIGYAYFEAWKKQFLTPPPFIDATWKGSHRQRFQSHEDLITFLMKKYDIHLNHSLLDSDYTYQDEQILIKMLRKIKRNRGWYREGEFRWIVHEFVERQLRGDGHLFDFETNYTDERINQYNGFYGEGKEQEFVTCKNSDCNGVVIIKDSIRGESYCPKCGLVHEHYLIETMKFPPYKTPGGDEANLERNGTYGDWKPYTQQHWTSPRNSNTRPKYKGRFYRDRLIDTMDTKGRSIFGRGSKSYYEQTLKKRVQNAGYGDPSLAWHDLNRSRPYSEDADEIRELERKKKRRQRFSAWELNLRNYCNLHNLPRWVYNESVYILKKIPAKFKMNQLHSRLGDEEKYGRRTVGIVLYVLERRTPKHPLLSEDDILTSAQYEVLKRNLHRLLCDCGPLPLYQ